MAGWPDKCSFCPATALSSFAFGALCVDNYRTFFRMHDALNKVNARDEPPASDLLVALQQINLAPLQYGDEALDAILRIASAAIAKAEGR